MVSSGRVSMRLHGSNCILFVIIALLLSSASCTTTTVHTVPQGYRSEPAVPEAQYEEADERGYFGTIQNEYPKRAPEIENEIKEEGCSCPARERIPAKVQRTPIPAIPERSAAEEQVQSRAMPPIDRSALSMEAAVVTPPVESPSEAGTTDFAQTGTASWYGRDFDGKATASGQSFDSRKLTAAHRTIPLGSIVLVRNMENDREILVTVNDRGPYVDGRVIDMSEYGAELLGYKERGLTTVALRVVRAGNMNAKGDGVTASYFAGESGKGGESSLPSLPLQRAKYSESSANVVGVENQRGFGVQVGVFGDLKNAMGMKSILSSYGEAVNIYKKQNYYIVSVGDYVTRYQAEQIKSELIADGYHAFIVEPSNSDYAQFR
jgi:rare lipoprotein A